MQGGKRALWVSISQDLRWDARRDIADIDAELVVPVFPQVCMPAGQGRGGGFRGRAPIAAGVLMSKWLAAAQPGSGPT